MAGQITESLACDGILLCRTALTGERVENWRAAIDACYDKLEIARRNGKAATISRLVGTREQFAPTASSFTIRAISSEIGVLQLLTQIATGFAGAWIRNILGNRLVCNLDRSWVRRQYAPSHYPPLHAPHGWHQDGALKFDFLSHSSGEMPPDSILNMVTCWISLDSCGVDAPGLELVTERLGGLLAPSDLRAESVQARFMSDKLWRPILEGGDALLFRGDILHRTHVTPEMINDRTSIELRFFSGAMIPERLESDRFIPFG